MARYEFYQDSKHTLWLRTRFSVEAPNEKAALLKAARIARCDLHTEEMQQEDIAVENSEMLYDSLEELPVEDNNDQPTLEIFLKDGENIADNISGPAWESWWEQADIRTKERITEIRSSDFDRDEYHACFICACSEWWDKHSAFEKIAIWKTYQE